MMSEKKRKWILITIGAVILLAPIVALNNYTLNRIQATLKARAEAGEATLWGTSLQKLQYRIAMIYRYTLRNESAADALQQYRELKFYEADKDGDDEAKARAQDFIWEYPSLLEDVQDQFSAYPYYKRLLEDWPDHPNHAKAQERVNQLEKEGKQFPPENHRMR